MYASYDMSDETNLIKNILDGNTRAFNDLVRQYEDTVFSFAFKVCRNREKAEETVQDTFVNVYRKLHQFDGRSKFTTWLYSIVTNNCLMKNRQRKIDDASVQFDEEHEHLQDRLSESTTPFETVMSDELRGQLDAAILKLPVEYRIVFILRDIEGLSANETATVLQLSVAAVKSRLHRARKALREHVSEYITL
jgi:RNA polymerase sigma-70 factor, ECF subfamily